MHNSPTPFTVYDSTKVSLQANSPPISGITASRPNLIGTPNTGPHTVEEWMSPSAFQRLNPVTQAGKFGNAGAPDTGGCRECGSGPIDSAVNWISGAKRGPVPKRC
jgi:hypothetical protein